MFSKVLYQYVGHRYIKIPKYQCTADFKSLEFYVCLGGKNIKSLTSKNRGTLIVIGILYRYILKSKKWYFSFVLNKGALHKVPK
jgi:hypothetical protein